MKPTIRRAEPRDVPAIAERHREQNERDGTDYPVPTLFDEYGNLMPNILLALVVEEDGEVLQAGVIELIGELLCFGCDPRATAVLRHEINAAMYLLHARGIQVALSAVPQTVVKSVKKPLKKAGFERRDDLVHFYRETNAQPAD